MNILLNNLLVGKLAKVNHPITIINPKEYFRIYEVRIEDDIEMDHRIYIRGKNTAWFGQESILIIKSENIIFPV